MTTEREEVKLKDCPMCRNKAVFTSGTVSKPYPRLQCSQCRLGYDVYDYGGDLGLVEACWNTRAPIKETENDA